MKKNFYLTIIGLLTFATTNAQITITATPVSSANYIDTFGEPSNLADFRVFADAKTNAKWDFTIAQYPDNGFYSNRTHIPTPNYPNSKFNQSISYIFAGGLRYDLTQHFDITNNSIVAIGEEVVTEQVLSIAAATGNANDELVFPVQDVKYSQPQLERQFPVTLGSHFTSTRVQETKFNITVTAYGLNNAPGIRKTVRTVKDTVIGWGTVKIKGAFYKRIYDNVPVLQVRRTITATDSFFLNGSPAPQALLDAFGLKQGKPENFYAINFIKQDELDELIYIYFDRSPFQTVNEVEIQENRLEQYVVTGLTDLSVQNAINVYPNPIVDNSITVDLPTNQSGDYTYSLKDIFGRNIADGAINTNIINLPSGLAKGNYILTISNNNAVVSINKVLK